MAAEFPTAESFRALIAMRNSNLKKHVGDLLHKHMLDIIDDVGSGCCPEGPVNFRRNELDEFVIEFNNNPGPSVISQVEQALTANGFTVIARGKSDACVSIWFKA